MIQNNNIDGEINILEYLKIIKKNIVWLIIIPLISGIITLVVSLRMPKIYSSTATILSPIAEEKSQIISLSRQLDNLGLPNLASGYSTTDIIISMLKSRRMAEDIVKKFNLRSIYKKIYIIDAINELKSATTITISREKAISITVESVYPQLASDIADYYVKNLDIINNELAITSNKPIVRILDVAYPSEYSTKPKIKQKVIIIVIITIIIVIIFIFFKDSLIKNKK